MARGDFVAGIHRLEVGFFFNSHTHTYIFIHTTQLDRVQYILRSYLRTRLEKVL